MAFDVKTFENRNVILVEDDLATGARRDFADEGEDGLVVFLRVDEDAVDVFREEVAHGAFDQARLLVKHAGLGGRVDHIADRGPALEEHVEVADEIAQLFAFPRRTDDDAHAFGNRQLTEHLFETVALGGVFDFAGNAALSGERHEDDEAARNRNIGRRTRSLGTDLSLRHLNDDFGTDREELGNVLDGILFPLVFLLFAFVIANEFDGGIVRSGQHVPIVQEGVLGFADIDECRLQALFEILDTAFVNRADDAFFVRAFEFVFFEHTVGEQRGTLFERLGIDDELAEAFTVLREVLDDTLNDGKFFGALSGILLDFFRRDGLDFMRLGRVAQVLIFVTH